MHPGSTSPRLSTELSELLAAPVSQPNSLWLLAVGLPRPNSLSGREACRQPSRDVGLGGDSPRSPPALHLERHQVLGVLLKWGWGT